MLGIDTNVLVRYLVRDDEQQFERVSRLIKREIAAGAAVYVSLPVLLEAEWVLRSRYRLRKVEILAAISALLDSTEIQFEDEPAIEESLKYWSEGVADFADCLIDAHNRRMGCRATATFDEKAARLSAFVSP
jgi:predicted nucleic-acid-binding protein